MFVSNENNVYVIAADYSLDSREALLTLLNHLKHPPAKISICNPWNTNVGLILNGINRDVSTVFVIGAGGNAKEYLDYYENRKGQLIVFQNSEHAATRGDWRSYLSTMNQREDTLVQLSIGKTLTTMVYKFFNPTVGDDTLAMRSLSNTVSREQLPRASYRINHAEDVGDVVVDRIDGLGLSGLVVDYSPKSNFEEHVYLKNTEEVDFVVHRKDLDGGLKLYGFFFFPGIEPAEIDAELKSISSFAKFFFKSPTALTYVVI